MRCLHTFRRARSRRPPEHEDTHQRVPVEDTTTGFPTRCGARAHREKQIVAANAAKRAEIKARIAKLEGERTKYLASERKKQATSDAPSLETELMKSTRKTASKKGDK